MCYHETLPLLIQNGRKWSNVRLKFISTNLCSYTAYGTAPSIQKNDQVIIV
ncbi:hypothetical protein T03_8784 [Trichinella britovi]|uniref:Uncharacterized protein n=1 Tax=Trichinella britovi TaxID=45882 RepID=A0A0V1D2L2_TRIBR|nr:hypothetical protein T03_8784 [Trichinella britovi]